MMGPKMTGFLIMVVLDKPSDEVEMLSDKDDEVMRNMEMERRMWNLMIRMKVMRNMKMMRRMWNLMMRMRMRMKRKKMVMMKLMWIRTNYVNVLDE